MEHRRKSGRGTTSEFILNCPVVTNPGPHWKDLIGWDVLEMHPAWRVKTEGMEKKEAGEGEDVETTFKLGLTEKERRDREGVILPYFDAQKGDGPGEGGRILYEYGEEDVGDWDSEEDEM